MCVLSIKMPIRKKSGNLFSYPRIYVKNKKILRISIFLFKAYINLKSWLIVPKGQLSSRQSFLILKLS